MDTEMILGIYYTVTHAIGVFIIFAIACLMTSVAFNYYKENQKLRRKLGDPDE